MFLHNITYLKITLRSPKCTGGERTILVPMVVLSSLMLWWSSARGRLIIALIGRQPFVNFIIKFQYYSR